MTTETKTQAQFNALTPTRTTDKMSVKLGYCDRDSDTLSQSSAIVMRTLEEYGHDVDKFIARSGHRIDLVCDHYRIDIRHRRSPTPLRQPDGTPCRSQVEIMITALYPLHTDQEITELLLAMMLHNLICDMDKATMVEWVDGSPEMPCSTFMSAFHQQPEPDNTPQHQRERTTPSHRATSVVEPRKVPVAAHDAFVSGKSGEAAHVEELVLAMEPVASDADGTAQAPKARDRFAPVDATFNELAEHCETLANSLLPKGAQPAVAQTEGQPAPVAAAKEKGISWSTLATWVATFFVGLVSIPLALTTVTVNLIRRRDLRYGVQMLAVLALVMLVQTAGLVQAALQ